MADVKVYSNADTVRLSVNGRPAGELRQADCLLRACVFRDVPLGTGVNRIAVTGDHGGRRVTDRVEWMRESDDIHIAAGQLTAGFRSSDGVRFGSDNFFVGGSGGALVSARDTSDLTRPRGTETPELFLGYREGRFRYEVPLENGSYEVTLRFLKPSSGMEPGQRVFDVVANGEVRIEKLDVLAAADGEYRRVVTRSFPVRVDDGRLQLSFEPRRSDAVVSNISIEATQPVAIEGTPGVRR